MRYLLKGSIVSVSHIPKGVGILVLRLVFAILVGCFVEVIAVYLIAWLGLTSFRGGGGILPTQNLDVLVFTFVKAVLGGAFGLVSALIAFAVFKKGMHSTWLMVALALGLGLANATIYSLIELNNSLYGKENTILDDLESRLIIATAAVEFAAGFVIGMATTLIAGRADRQRTPLA